MNLRLALLPTLLACLASGHLEAQATCIGNFVNQSSYVWSISGFDGTPNKLVIQPGQTASITYGQTTNITVSASIPNRPYTKQFQLKAGSGGACYTILYNGNPGYVKINKPNPGDIVTCLGGC